MRLTLGTRFGAYEILTLIGSGGMGEVYRASDPRLGRDVAIKVLRGAHKADRDHHRRFEQEARAAGALDHPNILTVHEVGTIDGSPYLVTELLDGETLRDALRDGALTLERTVDYGTQIANGLAAAHSRGVVHRDLKPENIFLTRDGRAKILDFGLAKLVVSGANGGEPMLTVAGADTIPGTVLGTVAYMSPEQVRGEVVDHRTDIFSFGAILYEMLSGVRAFAAKTPAETISAILTAEPVGRRLPSAHGPEPIDRVVRHCLKKSRDERFQSVKDVAFALATATESRHISKTPLSHAERYAWIAGVISLTAVLAVLLLGQHRAQSSRANITMLTTGRTTISGLIAPAIRSVLVSVEPEWNVDVRSTDAGSVEGVRLVERGEASLAFVNSVVAFHAVKTDRVLGHRSNTIAGVAVLWGITAQMMVAADSSVRRIDDVRGKKLSIGVDGSGDRFCSDILLDHFGIRSTDVFPVSLDPDRSVNAVMDSSLDGVMLWRGVPAPEIERGFETGRMRLVPFDPDALESLHVKNPFLRASVIPARVYPHQSTAVTSVQTKMLLVASRSVDADVIERILRAVADHLRDLIAAHPAASEFLLNRMPTLEDGMSIDLHPGAERFFRARR